MIRATPTQLLQALNLATAFEAAQRAKDGLGSREAYTARLMLDAPKSASDPLGQRGDLTPMDVPVPRAAVLLELNARMDCALEQLRALGIELMPDTATASAGNRLGEKYDGYARGAGAILGGLPGVREIAILAQQCQVSGAGMPPSGVTDTVGSWDGAFKKAIG